MSDADYGLPANLPESIRARLIAAHLAQQSAAQQTAPYTSKGVVALKALTGLLGGLQERSAIDEAEQGQANQRRLMAQILLNNASPSAAAAGGGSPATSSTPGMIPGSSPTSPAGALPTGNSSTRDLAIRTIYGEAGGEPDVGKAGVAAVLKNRLASGQFGPDMNSVIMAPKQFSLWNPGDPAGDTARKLSSDSPAYQKIGAIYDGVMSGDVADPTGGATHYYNPKAASPSWGPKLAVQNDVTIGNHRFVGAGPTGPNGGATASADVPAPNAQSVASDTLPPNVTPAMVSAQPSPFGAPPSAMAPPAAGSADSQALAAALKQQAGISAPSAPSPSPFGAMPMSMDQSAPAGPDPMALAAALRASTQGTTPSVTPPGPDVAQPPVVPPPQDDLTAPSPFGAGPSPIAPANAAPNSQALAAALRQQVGQQAPAPAVPSPSPQDPTGGLSPAGLQMAAMGGGDPTVLAGMAQAAPPVSAAPLSTDNAVGFDNLNTTTNPDGTPAVTQSSLGAPGFTGAPADGSVAAAINGNLPGPQGYVGGALGLGTGAPDPSAPSPSMLAQALRQSAPTPPATASAPAATPMSPPTQPQAAPAPMPPPSQVAALPGADDPVGGLMGAPNPSDVAGNATRAMQAVGMDTTGLTGAMPPQGSIAGLGPAASIKLAKDAAANGLPMLAGANVPSPDLSGLGAPPAAPPPGAAMPLMATQAANPPAVLAQALRASSPAGPSMRPAGDTSLPETRPVPPSRPSDVALGLDPNAPAPNAANAGPASVPPGLLAQVLRQSQPNGLPGDGGADPSSPQAFMRQEAQRAAGGASPSMLAQAMRGNSPATASAAAPASASSPPDSSPFDGLSRLFNVGGGSSSGTGGNPLSGLPIIGDLFGGGQQNGAGPNGQAAGSSGFGGQGQAQPFNPGGQGGQPGQAGGGQGGSAPVAGLNGISQAQAVALLTNPYTTPQQAEFIMSKLNPQPVKVTAGESLAGRRPDGTYGTLYSAPTKPDWTDLGNGMMVDKNDPTGRAMPIPGGRAPVKMSPGDVLQGPNGPVASVPVTPDFKPVAGTGTALNSRDGSSIALPGGAGSTVHSLKVNGVDVPVMVTPDPNGGTPKVQMLTPGAAPGQPGAPGGPISFNGASQGGPASAGPLDAIAPLVKQAGQMKADESAQVKEADTQVGDQAKIAQAGRDARVKLAQLDQLEQLSGKFGNNIGTKVNAKLNEWGWPTQSGTDQDAFKGLVGALAVGERPAGSGALRVAEMDAFKSNLGDASMNQAGRIAAINRYRTVLQRDAQIGDLAADTTLSPGERAARIQGLSQQPYSPIGGADGSGVATPPGGAPTASAAPPQTAPAASDALAQAQAAIARGAPRAAVIQRLQAAGINPAGL